MWILYMPMISTCVSCDLLICNIQKPILKTIFFIMYYIVIFYHLSLLTDISISISVVVTVVCLLL